MNGGGISQLLPRTLAYANPLAEEEGEYPEESCSTSFITMYPGLGKMPLTIGIPNKKGELRMPASGMTISHRLTYSKQTAVCRLYGFIVGTN